MYLYIILIVTKYKKDQTKLATELFKYEKKGKIWEVSLIFASTKAAMNIFRFLSSNQRAFLGPNPLTMLCTKNKFFGVLIPKASF